jgi:hypothetical protein
MVEEMRRKMGFCPSFFIENWTGALRIQAASKIIPFQRNQRNHSEDDR